MSERSLSRVRRAIVVVSALCFAIDVPASPASQEDRPAPGQRQIRVITAERARAFSHITPPNKDSVVLVLTLSGFTEHDWNRLPLSSFAVSSGTDRYPCQLRTAASLKPNLFLTPNSSVGDRRVAFVVPAGATSLYLHFRDQPPIAFSPSAKIQRTVL
jgi:hypothetical protein